MHDPSPDLYDAKLKKINGVSAQRTQQTKIYFIATSDRGPSVSRHRNLSFVDILKNDWSKPHIISYMQSLHAARVFKLRDCK